MGVNIATFIKIVVNWWKMLNFKSIDVDVMFNNKLQAVVQDPLDERLNMSLQFGEMMSFYQIVDSYLTD